jgi:hypothetical protein
MINNCRIIFLLSVNLCLCGNEAISQTGIPLPPLSTVVEVKVDNSSSKISDQPKNDSNSSNSQASTINPSNILSAKKIKVPNSVAVTEFYIRKDYIESFYDEKLNSRSSIDAQSNPVRSLQDDDSVNADSNRNTNSITINAKSEFNYSKSSGAKRVISFSEVRGLNSAIKSFLLKSGYTVIQPAPYIHNGKEDIDIYNIKDRADRGDFYDAEFVLQGAVVNVQRRSTNEAIQGSSDFSFRQELSITVEFNLISTETLQVLSSFTVSGNGLDMYLGKYNATYVPNKSKILRNLLSSFNADAQIRLNENLPLLSRSEVKSAPQSPKSEGIGDPSTLIIYKSSKEGSGKTSNDNQPPVTIYKK